MKVAYYGNSPSGTRAGEGPYWYFFPYNAPGVPLGSAVAVDVDPGLLDLGFLENTDFVAADAAAQVYVPTPPRTFGAPRYDRSSKDLVDENGASLPVVRGGALTMGTATPTTLDAGSIYLKNDAGGLVTDFYMAAGTGFGTVLQLSSPPTTLAANEIAAVTNPAGLVTDFYFGASA